MSESPPDQLYPYQEEAVSFLLERKRAILGFEMGLGKTPISIQTLFRGGVQEGLIFCPVTVRLNWRRELIRWYPGVSVFIYSGAGHIRNKVWEEYQEAEGPKCLITSYAMLPELLGRRAYWPAIVYDECHQAGLKNRKSKTFKAAVKLHSAYLLLLSGTPASKGPQDYWAYLHLISPAKFPHFWPWIKKHVVHYKTHFGWVLEGAQNPADMREHLAPYRLRMLKRDVRVGNLIPPFNRRAIYVEMAGEQKKIYNEVAEEWMTLFEDGPPLIAMTRIAQLIRLRQICVTPALVGGPNVSASLNALSDFIQSMEEPLVVFSPFREALPYVVDVFPKEWDVSILHGQLDPDRRDEIIQGFKTNRNPLRAVACVTSLAQGFDLTAASYAICIGFDWAPHINYQAESRIDRHGQSGPSYAYYIINEGSVERDVLDILDQKIAWAKALEDPSRITQV